MALIVKRATICLTANMVKQMQELCEYYDDNISRILRLALEELHRNIKIKKTEETKK